MAILPNRSSPMKAFKALTAVLFLWLALLLASCASGPRNNEATVAPPAHVNGVAALPTDQGTICFYRRSRVLGAAGFTPILIKAGHTYFAFLAKNGSSVTIPAEPGEIEILDRDAWGHPRRTPIAVAPGETRYVEWGLNAKLTLPESQKAVAALKSCHSIGAEVEEYRQAAWNQLHPGMTSAPVAALGIPLHHPGIPTDKFAQWIKDGMISAPVLVFGATYLGARLFDVLTYDGLTILYDNEFSALHFTRETKNSDWKLDAWAIKVGNNNFPWITEIAK